jgi:hypothetical protein
LRTTLKDKAVFIRALAEGLQTIMIRKGGIEESQAFLLYPLYEKQNPEYYQKKYYELVRASTDPQRDRVEITSWVSVVKSLKLYDALIIPKLKDHYIWNPKYFEPPYIWERFQFEPGEEKYFNIPVLRTFRLSQPQFVKPIASSRFICACHRPYVDLPEEIDTDGSQPVLSDKNFGERLRALETIVAG